MHNVLTFKQKPVKGLQPAVKKSSDAPRYFCLSCDGDVFKFYADNSIHCASCTALIKNLEGRFKDV